MTSSKRSEVEKGRIYTREAITYASIRARLASRAAGPAVHVAAREEDADSLFDWAFAPSGSCA